MERRLRLVFSQIPGAVWTTDRQLRITYAIGRLQDQKIDERRVVGQTIHQFLHTDDPLEPAIAHHYGAVAGQSRNFRYSLRGRCYEVHVQPLRDAEGAIVGSIGVGVDVTDRCATELQLVRSQARLAEAQRVAHVGSWEWEVSTNQVSWSEEMYRIYGLEPGHFGGSYESFLGQVHPDDMEHTQSVVLTAYRAGKPFTYDHRIVRPDGEVRMLHTRGDVALDEHARPLRLFGSCWDITDRWEAEQKLASSVSLLRATLESTADGLLVVDRGGRVTAWNEQLLALWGLPRGLVEGQDFETLLSLAHEQVENGDEGLRRARELWAQPAAESFDTLLFLDGRVFERYSRPQRIGEAIVGRVWSFRDVTLREGLLRRALFLADASRLLASLDVESALEAVARLSLQAMADACAIDLLGEEGGPRRLLSVARDPARPVGAELPQGVLTGRAQLVSEGGRSVIVVPISAHAQILGALTFVSIEKRRYSDADLQLFEELAQRAALALENARLYRREGEALKARDEFLSIAAHELRGPLTSLHLAAQALKRGALSDPAQRLSLEVIEREDRRLARFVDELLDVSRVRMNGLQFDLSPVDLAALIRETVARMTPELNRSRSPLSVTTPAEVVGTWDRARLEQVISNLLANAIKFGLGRPIDVSLSAEGGLARLAVRDEGIGIPPDRQEQIFEPFERAVSARHYGGLGLGLYIVRRIVAGLGGTVTVQSQPGAGSTFLVELPQAPGGKR